MNITKVITTIFILLLLSLGAVFLYSKYQDSKDYFIYKGANGDYRIDIFLTGNQTDYYVYSVSDDILYRIPLRKKPQDVEAIPLEPNLLDKITRPSGTHRVYITQDPGTANKTAQYSILALIDIGKILGKAEYGIYKLNVQGALTMETPRSKEIALPIITCNTVNETVSVIYLTLGTENKVYSEKDCIIVEGKDTEGLTLAANKFAYYLLGVF